MLTASRLASNRRLALVPLLFLAFGCSAATGGSAVSNSSGGRGGSQPASGDGGSSGANPTGSNGGDTPSTGGTGGNSTGGNGGSIGGSQGSAGSSGTGGAGDQSGGGTGGAGGDVADGSVAPPPPSADGVAWGQAGGPDGTFRVNVPDAPTTWSVAANTNILWRAPLPDEGQGGIAIAGNTLFLSTFPPFTGSKTSMSILGHAIDATNGKILWSVMLTGNTSASPMAYSYSDATSWTPVTDGKSVCFFTSTGEMGCWDMTGKELWRRQFPGQPGHFPFNRQHEPIIYGNQLIVLSPLGMGDPAPKAGQGEWNYLHGIDKATGKTLWIAEQASTFYNTAVMGKMADGTPAILHGRGGPHGVAERPVGMTLTSLAPGNEGKAIWNYDAPSGDTALYTMTWDQKYAYWWHVAPNEAQVVVDTNTGKVLRTQSLSDSADVRYFDTATSTYTLHAAVNIRQLADNTYGGGTLHVMPNWHTNIAAGGYHWFLTSTNNNRSGGGLGGHSGPPHCVGRVNVETGKVEYLEVPVGIDRSPGAAEKRLYGKSLTTTAADYKGNDVAQDGRSHTDGWEIPAFYASPIALGNKIYFGTTMGITYVLDANAAVLDEKALLGIGDLGPNGKTWSLAGPSYANGVMYHHSSKEVVAIKVGAPAAAPPAAAP